MSVPLRRRHITRPASSRILCCALTFLTVAAAACSGPQDRATDETGNGVTTTSSAVPSPAPSGRPLRAEEVTVLDAYQRFWAVAGGVGRRPEREWRSRLAAVTADPFLSELVDGLLKQKERGVVDFGTVELRPTIASVLPGRASVLDCQDASRSGEIDRDTGEVKSVGSSRTPFTATLTEDPSGHWRVTRARYLPDPC